MWQIDERKCEFIKGLSPIVLHVYWFSLQLMWKVGDSCLAPYSGDNELYLAVIQEIKNEGNHRTACVRYLDYSSDENEIVPLVKLKETSGAGVRVITSSFGMLCLFQYAKINFHCVSCWTSLVINWSHLWRCKILSLSKEAYHFHFLSLFFQMMFVHHNNWFPHLPSLSVLFDISLKRKGLGKLKIVCYIWKLGWNW